VEHCGDLLACVAEGRELCDLAIRAVENGADIVFFAYLPRKPCPANAVNAVKRLHRLRRICILQSDALKIYVSNVMTQEGETEGYTTADHIQAIFNHSRPGLFDLCLVNNAPIPGDVLERYAQEGAEPIHADEPGCRALGVELVRRPVSRVEKGYVRHDPELLAQALMELHGCRSVRIAGGGYQKEV